MSVLAHEAYDSVLAAEQLTGEELQRLIDRGGRDSGPWLLQTAHTHKKITDRVLAELVGDVWSMADRPDRELTHDEWRLLFDAAGFTIDGQRTPRPTQPTLLYRGSVPERRSDWSWTKSVAVARRYAAGNVTGRAPGRLWVCTAPPAHMLTINTGRGEDEVVIDTRGLTVWEVPS
ncbi:hypothetical protein [Streptomyces sp. NPDC058045]|uniref:hypothetical protein n=1 Tax=Streptomyces sp. NPDC058045 TaxID=3346311 RepID=UPI0036EF4F43